MIFGGSLTMFAGGWFSRYLPSSSGEFTAPIFLVGLADSGYFVVRMFAARALFIRKSILPKHSIVFSTIASKLMRLLMSFSTKRDLHPLARSL